MEHIRQFVNDWASVIAAVIGLALAWEKARLNEKIRRAILGANLFRRVAVLETDVDELQEQTKYLEQRLPLSVEDGGIE